MNMNGKYDALKWKNLQSTKDQQLIVQCAWALIRQNLIKLSVKMC